jgi:hypothetical protein
LILLVVLVGLVYLDVTENGRGVFASAYCKENTLTDYQVDFLIFHDLNREQNRQIFTRLWTSGGY